MALIWASGSVALEYRSVGDAPAVLYDGPSLRTSKILIISPGTPVEVVSSLEGWVKIRESGGQLAWIESKALGDKRTVVVTAQSAQVRATANETGALVFEAQRGVILELLEPGGAWIRVKHRDGLAGFVRANQVWGL